MNLLSGNDYFNDTVTLTFIFIGIQPEDWYLLFSVKVSRKVEDCKICSLVSNILNKRYLYSV